MWGNSNRGRPSTGSEVVMIDDGSVVTSPPEMPNINNVNVTNSTRVHLGPKFVNVNQTVHNSEVIKGQLLGLELVSGISTRRLRCSVAVFVCWSFLVASALVTGIIYLVLYKTQTLLDIDLPFPSYLCTLIKSTTKVERMSCAAAIIALIICITLITYFSLTSATKDEFVDVAPHEWNITREMWLAKNFTENAVQEKFIPLKLVIIQHTVSAECDRFINCAAELRTLQSYFVDGLGWDIPYNFVIGNDGRVYEGRGYAVVGAHTLNYNSCSMGLGFIGDYRENEGTQNTKVSKIQLNRTLMLLEESVRIGFLDPNYYVVGAKDVRNTESPGTNLYNAIRKWDHYDHKHQFRNKSCDDIYEEFYNHKIN